MPASVSDIGENPDAERAPHPLAGIRHDLSSPLTVIRGHGQLLRLHIGDLDVPASDRERLDGHLDAIEAALERIEAMLFPEVVAARRRREAERAGAGEDR